MVVGEVWEIKKMSDKGDKFDWERFYGSVPL